MANLLRKNRASPTIIYDIFRRGGVSPTAFLTFRIFSQNNTSCFTIYLQTPYIVLDK